MMPGMLTQADSTLTQPQRACRILAFIVVGAEDFRTGFHHFRCHRPAFQTVTGCGAHHRTDAFTAPVRIAETQGFLLLWREPAVRELLLLRCQPGLFACPCAVRTECRQQTLGNQPLKQTAAAQEALRHADDLQAVEISQRTVGVLCGQHDVTGFGKVDGGHGGVMVADFTDIDRIRVQTEHGTTTTQPGEVDVLLAGAVGGHRGVDGPFDFPLHRVLLGDDASLSVAVLQPERHEAAPGRGFTGTGGAGVDDDGIRTGEHGVDDRNLCRQKAECLQ